MRLMASTPRRLPVTRLVAALVWLHATALLGQVSDTTSSWPPDVPPDVPLFDRDITRILSGDAASFVYDFGAFGWPSGWSPYGMSPQWVALNFNGIPFDDPVTGRPHYDLLPTALLAPPWMREAARGSPVLADTGLRTFDTAEPLTELHYQTGDDGLKRATVLHGQTRGAVTGLFVYSGAGAKGEYPGSRLQRMRQLLLRAGLRRSGWSASAMYLHSQRRLGAHGGVEGPAIYNRLIADVRLSAAMRRAIRHDAQLVLRARPFGAPLVATAAFTAYHLRFTHPGQDTVSAGVYRMVARLRQSASSGAHRISLEFETWLEDVARLHLTVRDSVAWRRFGVVAEAGVHFLGHTGLVGGKARLTYDLGSLEGYAEAWRAGQPLSWIVRHGWEDYVAVTEIEPAGRVAQGRLGLRMRFGLIDAETYGFARRQTNILDFFQVDKDRAAVHIDSSAAQRAGIGARIGFRSRARRGLYGVVQPTILQPEASLPSFFMRGRLGARYHLFAGDLGLDLSLRGHYWTSFQGRTLHAPTGLLVRRPEMLPASGALDLYVEAVVRGATLLVAYENMLSGTAVMEGNQVVLGYPLPAQFLRFGVYWPIRN